MIVKASYAAADMAKQRKRRSAEGARDEILAAAERHLVAHGPAGLRLQELAAEVGVSHPAILHHFGSREGLVNAVVERAVGKLQHDLIAAIAGSGDQYAGVALFDRVHRTLATHGHARLMAWLLLEGYEPLDSPDIRAQWNKIIDSTHAARTMATKNPDLPREDTAFTVMLTALATFAQALGGPALFHAGGLGKTQRVQTQFRSWLSDMIGQHMTRAPK
jgi:AcrR family transcriptional regulator